MPVEVSQLCQQHQQQQDVRGQPYQGKMAVTAEPSLHSGRTADQWSLQCVECLRWPKPLAQHNGANIQARLSCIRCQCECSFVVMRFCFMLEFG